MISRSKSTVLFEMKMELADYPRHTESGATEWYAYTVNTPQGRAKLDQHVLAEFSKYHKDSLAGTQYEMIPMLVWDEHVIERRCRRTTCTKPGYHCVARYAHDLYRVHHDTNALATRHRERANELQAKNHELDVHLVAADDREFSATLSLHKKAEEAERIADEHDTIVRERDALLVQRNIFLEERDELQQERDDRTLKRHQLSQQLVGRNALLAQQENYILHLQGNLIISQ